MPLRGVKRLLPGHLGVFEGGQLSSTPYFTLREQLDPALEDQATAVRRVRALCTKAVEKRLNGEPEVGLYLSGGIDSSGVAVWLKEAGVKVQAFSLDFGERSVEREQAEQVAKQLEHPADLGEVRGRGRGRPR